MSKPRPYQIVRPHTAKERADLKASIEQNGILVPIIVDVEGQIIDGHGRAMLAKELGMKCPREVRYGLTEQEKLDLAETLILDWAETAPEAEKKELLRFVDVQLHSIFSPLIHAAEAMESRREGLPEPPLTETETPSDDE